MGVYENFFLFLKLIEAYLINKQVVFKNIIAEKYYKKGDPNYVQTFKDNIKMSLIIADSQKP